MHPPKHILEMLQALHPQVRLGWQAEAAGGYDGSDDTDNRGQFVLLQLYHKRDADNTFLDFWNEIGPVYGKPFDPLQRTPVMVKAFSKAEVFSGNILDDVKEMMRPLRERYEVSAREKGAAEAAGIRNLSEEAGSYLWHRKNKRDNGNNVAKKHEPFVDPTRSSDQLKDAYLGVAKPSEDRGGFR